jgi:hypothetical protein
MDDACFINEWKDKKSKVQFCLEPFLEAYKDSMEPLSSSGCLDTPVIQRTGGMSDDPEQYWERSIPVGFNPTNPSIQSLAYYPLRIVAAMWVKYAAVTLECTVGHEHKDNGDPALEKFDIRLQELQSWRRRSMISRQKVQSVLSLLKEWMAKYPTDAVLLQPLITDYEYINANIEESGRMLERSVSVVISVVQIFKVRWAFTETTNITRLTILSLIFFPLSYISSLFSMNPSNAPGSSHFFRVLCGRNTSHLVSIMIALSSTPKA